MKSFKLLLALFLALAYTNLVVLAREAELETQLRGGPFDVDDDIDDDGDDDDDLLMKAAIHQAADRVCKVFGERDDKRDVLNIQRRGWLKKVWKGIKKTAEKVWDNVKPHVLPAVIGAVTGKRGDLADATLELNAEEKRALESLARDLGEDESVETLLRKRGWLKKAFNTVKNGVTKVVDKVKEGVQKVVEKILPPIPFPPHFPFPGKRSDLSETEDLDEETQRALEEFTRALRDDGDSLDKRGKFWDKVKKFWKNVVRPVLKKVLRKRQADEVTECDADLSDIRDALDVLNTVVGMAEDVEGCGTDDDAEEGDDDMGDADIDDDGAAR